MTTILQKERNKKIRQYLKYKTPIGSDSALFVKNVQPSYDSWESIKKKWKEKKKETPLSDFERKYTTTVES